MNVDFLTGICSEFRNAIERIPTKIRNRVPTLTNFPCGSCGEASLLLGTYLIDFHHLELDYWMGYYFTGTDRDRDDWYSHAWLERDSLVIDITADQFEEVDNQIIVSLNSSWHKKLQDIENDGIANYRRYKGSIVQELDIVYSYIIYEIEQKYS